MKYIDRMGNVTVEENGQDKLLRHLYNDRGGRLCLRVLVSPWISKMAGRLLNTGFSARFVGDFVEKNRIDLSICEKQKFSSWNDFFTRRLRQGERPVDEREKVLVSPCDGKLSVYRIDKNSRFWIKDTEYTVEQLLRNKSLAERYLGGYALVFRLTVDDYHRYCYFDDGIKSENHRIDGVYHTVNPIANDHVKIYKENTREYTMMKTKHFGDALQMEVGALMVGKIVNHDGAGSMKRGIEKGYFQFGGSTIILLFEKDRVEIREELLERTKNQCETKIKQGEMIGRALV